MEIQSEKHLTFTLEHEHDVTPIYFESRTQIWSESQIL